ncbi:MAG: EamA family transporter [Actinomycetota bacterium]
MADREELAGGHLGERVTDRRRSTPPAEAYFVASAVSQYLGASIAVSLFDRMPTGAVALTRVAAAALILIVWRRPWDRSWNREQLVAAAGFGVATAAMNLTFYLAAARIDLGAGVAIEFIGPVTVAAIGVRTRRNIGALLLTVAGIALMTTFASDAERTGIAFALLAGSMWGLYIVMGRRVAVGGGGIDGLGVGMVIGALAISPFGAGGFGPVGDAPWLLAAGASVGLLSNVVPYTLDQLIFGRLPRERFALLLALLPVTAAIIGLLVLGQVPAWREAAGIALIVAAIAVRDRGGEDLSRRGPGRSPAGRP